MDKGYVAFLDVLGFAATVRGSNAPARIDAYRKCLASALDDLTKDPAREGPSPQNTLKASVFSDSIILAVLGGDREALLSLLRRTSRVFKLMLDSGIALRGAIAFGPIESTPLSVGTFFAGSAITEAYEYEEAQDWIGIMLAPSVIQANADLWDRCDIGGPDGKPPPRQFVAHEAQSLRQLQLRLEWASVIQHCARIPFHPKATFDSRSYDGFVLVPSDGWPTFQTSADNARACIDALQRLRSVAPSPEAQLKYDHSMNWYRGLHAQWEQIVAHEVALRRDGKWPI